MNQPYKIMDMKKQQRRERKKTKMAIDLGLISQRDNSYNSSIKTNKINRKGKAGSISPSMFDKSVRF